MGELRQRGKVWWIRYYRNGKRYEESSGSKLKGKATDLLKIREGAVARGVPVTPAMGRVTFDSAVQDVVNDYTTNGRRSVDDVKRRITLHLSPYFGGRRMTSLTTSDVRAYTAARLEAGAKPASVNRELAIVKRAFRLAVKAQTILSMPHVPLLAEDNTRQGFFEAADFEDVRKALPEALRGVVTVAYLTGWRINSEVLPLQWAQVDRTASIIRLEPGSTKNRKGRTLPYDLLPELVTVIDDAWAAHVALAKAGTVCPFVFQRDGKAIKNFRTAWANACEAAGVVGRIPHDLRRTAVRNLVRHGVPARTAMMITGHKTRSVFDRYDVVDEADVREGLGRLADVTGTKKGQSTRSGRVARFTRTRKRKIA